MRNINIVFDEDSHEVIASVDGWETYLVSPKADGQGFAGTYELKVKSDVKNEWHTPEDDGPHEFDKFEEACDAIMQYLRNGIGIADLDLQGL